MFQPLDPIQEIEQYMQFNQFWDAYTRLNKLIESKKNQVEPKLYRLRALCAIKMAMPKECISDCSKIIKGKPGNDDLRTALIYRATAHLQLGDFTAATKDAKSANDQKTIRLIDDAIRLSRNAENFVNNGQLDDAKKYLDNFFRNCPKASKYLLMRADIAWLESDFQKYEELTNGIGDEYANDPKMNYRRGIIKLCQDKINDAKKCLTTASKDKKAPKNATLALKTITSILTHRRSAETFLSQKDQEKAEYELNLTIDATKLFCPANSQLVQSTNLLQIKLLKLKNDKHQIIEVLDEMIKSDSTNLDLILERGELYLELEDHDAALFDFSSVLSQNPKNRRAQEGMQKAEEMKKAANHVDHYKTLNVSKHATISEIKSAYRKMVIKWHPDRYSNKEDKKTAEAMMKKINMAYEILSDERRRNMYDQGIDPDDPMSGQGGGSPFSNFDPFDIIRQTMGGQQGGNPFDFFFGDDDGGGQQNTFTFGGGGNNAFHFEFHF